MMKGATHENAMQRDAMTKDARNNSSRKSSAISGRAMKKSVRQACLPLALLVAASAPAWGGELDRLQNLSQSEFRQLSEDLGAAASSKVYTPSAPLGITGFDLAVNLTATSMQHHDIIQRASSSSVPSTFPLVQVRAMKGLPWDIDVGASYVYVPGTDIKVFGGEVRYAIVSGGIVMPAVSLRGSYTRMSGIDQLDLDTKGVDISVSKQILLVTPYAGAGYVHVTSTPKGVAGLGEERFGYPKLFAGVRASLGVVAFTAEVDKTGDTLSYGVRFGIGF